MSGLRQAALCIHGLSSNDQKWVLKKLPRQYRLALKTMLKELDSIGIPAERNWLPGIEKKIVNEKSDADFSDVVKEHIKTIDGATTLQIKKLLLSESDEFIAVLLFIRYWRWQDDFLNALTKKRKQCIEALMHKNNIKTKKPVMEEIINIVAQKIPANNLLKVV